MLSREFSPIFGTRKTTSTGDDVVRIRKVKAKKKKLPQKMIRKKLLKTSRKKRNGIIIIIISIIHIDI